MIQKRTVYSVHAVGRLSRCIDQYIVLLAHPFGLPDIRLHMVANVEHPEDLPEIGCIGIDPTHCRMYDGDTN